MATGEVKFDLQNFRTTLPSGMMFIDWAEGRSKRDRLVRKVNFLFAFLTAEVQTGSRGILGCASYADLLPHVEILALEFGLGCGVVPEAEAIYRWWLRAVLGFDKAKEVYTWNPQPLVVKFDHDNVSFTVPREVTHEVIGDLYCAHSGGAQLTKDELTMIDWDLQLLTGLLKPEVRGGVNRLKFEIDPGIFHLCVSAIEPAADQRFLCDR